MCILFLSGVTNMVSAENPSSIPKITFSFDFNTLFSDDNALGARIQVHSNNNYFGRGRNRKRHNNDHAIAYTYGLGFGGYKVNSLEKKGGSEDDLYLLFASFTICYQNQGIFEPFAGIYPGMAWGPESGFFANPVAGINFTAFRLRRNWNSIFFQTYGQVRLEYNTMLSTTFLGCGLILQIL